MSKNGQDKVIAFDTLFTNNHIQMLKILLPYFDRSMQRDLAIHIKFLELQHTLSFLQKYPSASLLPLPRENSLDPLKMCNEILPFCGPEEKPQMEGMRNMYQTFESYKGMMEMVQMMKELFPEGEGSANSQSFDPEFLSSIMGMSGMAGASGTSGIDLSQMFEMFQTMSGSGGDTNGTE